MLPVSLYGFETLSLIRTYSKSVREHSAEEDIEPNWKELTREW
jgi:hypothetical protein